MRRECQSGAGTARYASASWNSTGSRVVGEPEPESDAEPKESRVAVELEERKFNRGVKSYRRSRRETRSFPRFKRRLEDEECSSSSSGVEEDEKEVVVAVAVAATGGRNTRWWRMIIGDAS